jgi:hypothetical protein
MPNGVADWRWSGTARHAQRSWCPASRSLDLLGDRGRIG